MNTLLYLRLPALLALALPCLQLLHAQVMPVVYKQGGPSYLYFQAESFQLLDPASGASSLQWTVANDMTAQGGKALQVSGTTVGPMTKQGALTRAKVQYNLQFSQTGNYYLYLRAKRVVAGGAGPYPILYGALNGLPTTLGNINILNSAAGNNYRWYRLSGATFNVSDLQQLYTLNLRPDDGRISIDAVVLSTNGGMDTGVVDLLIAGGSSMLAEASTPNNVLQYTSFGNGFAEFPLDNLTRRANVIDASSADGSTFAMLGETYMRLNTTTAAPTTPRIVFQEVGIDCGYTSLTFCFHYATPDPNDNVFEANDTLKASVRFRNLMGGVINNTFSVLTGNMLNLTSSKYQMNCGTIMVPAGYKVARFTIDLIADESDEDIFIDDVYLQSSLLPPGPAPVVNFQIDAASGNQVSFDASGSVNAGSFSYNFGDGTPSTEWVTDAQPLYIYPAPLVYEACAAALDGCGNRADIACVIVDLLAALPVDWLSFDVKAESSGARLQWATARERNNHFFDIERSNDGGRTFVPIGRIAGAGDADAPSFYTFFDEAPLPGDNYYRLRQVDFGGAQDYSEVRVLRWAGTAPTLSLYPNPATDKVYLKGTFSGGEYELKNALGQTVLSGNAAQPEIGGLGALAPGAYWLLWRPADGSERLRLPLVLADR